MARLDAETMQRLRGYAGGGRISTLYPDELIALLDMAERGPRSQRMRGALERIRSAVSYRMASPDDYERAVESVREIVAWWEDA